ncbi:MAG: hypothetical protein H0V81_01050 [Solirubrobacterales bacterium]|nr:hypothetical protein [Solirubrobacterales bacterium]
MFVLGGCGGSGAENEVATAAQATPPTVTATPRPIADNAEADESFATDASVELTEKAPKPGAVGKAAETLAKAQLISPGAPSDEEIARELKQMDAAVAAEGSGRGRGARGLTLGSDGTATPGPGTPEVVKRVIAGANAIAKFPYVYGGGHGSFVDTAYDCSGSLSYALAAGGLLDVTKTSGELARTGEKGPGEWITIYANAGHTFMVVDGLRYDTSGRGGPLGSRWNASPRSTKGFQVTHPPGF